MNDTERVLRWVDGELDATEEAALIAEAARRPALSRAIEEARELARQLTLAAASERRSPPEDLVERHHAALYSLCSRLLRGPGEAEDAVQETFARAYCAIDRFDCRYRLSTWLHRIAVNVCRDQWRSGRAREQREAQDAVTALDHVVDQPETLLQQRRSAQAVRDALERLGASYREVLVLKDMHELSYEEIHAITGTPITALKIRAIRGRQKLRKLLGEGP